MVPWPFSVHQGQNAMESFFICNFQGASILEVKSCIVSRCFQHSKHIDQDLKDFDKGSHRDATYASYNISFALGLRMTCEVLLLSPSTSQFGTLHM